jgi:hypothetical protein
MLDTAAADDIEPTRLEALRHETDLAVAALGQLGATAPDDASRAHTTEAAETLRSYMLAIEAERVVHNDATATDDARADANVTRRARATAVDEAFAKLDRLVHPPQDQPISSPSGATDITH